MQKNLTHAVECFNLSGIHIGEPTTQWYGQWSYMPDTLDCLSTEHKTALSRLMPLLLCGEQSAVQVFHQEIDRIRENADESALQTLYQIEADEYLHAKALMLLAQQLPTPDDLHHIKRRAQHFFLSINRHKEHISEHFKSISQLDACVTIIMHAMENSYLSESDKVQFLFKQIKQDEARHVSFSRHYAKKFVTPDECVAIPTMPIQAALVDLLSSEQTSFEVLGVNFETLKKRLLGLIKAGDDT